jgi:hypothetical protein
MATRKISYREAINEALAQEMERDSTVIIMGEDVAGGAGGQGEDDAWGGVLGVTKACTASSPDACWTRLSPSPAISVPPSALPRVACAPWPS